MQLPYLYINKIINIFFSIENYHFMLRIAFKAKPGNKLMFQLLRLYASYMNITINVGFAQF